MGDTTIRVPEELAERLWQLKNRGDSYADVIRRLLEEVDEPGLSEVDRGETSRSSDATPSKPPNAPREPAEQKQDESPSPDRSESRGDAPDDVRAAVAVDEFPATVDTEAALVAIGAARDHIRREGKASMRELVAEVMPDHSLGYDVPELEPGDRYRGAWWRRVVRPGLQALDDVEQPAGGGAWRWSGDDSEVYDPTTEF